MNRNLFLYLTALTTAAGLGVYTSFSPDPDIEYADDWTYWQIDLTNRLGKNPFSFDKRLQRGLENTQEKVKTHWQKVTEKAKARWQKITGYVPPEETPFNCFIGESRIPSVPPFKCLRKSLAEEDARKIIKEYGEHPFEFSTGDMIQTDDCIRQLEQAGYHPQRGVYDLSSPECDLEGFTVPLKHCAMGYALLTQQGKIIRIRELRDYAQYLKAKEQKKEYTATGNTSFFLPNITKILLRPAPPAVNKDWPEQLISYAYLAGDETASYANPESRRQTISQKVYFKAYDYMYEHIYQHCYLSLSDEDREQIIRKYGKKPLCLSHRLRKGDQAALMRRLKAAGYTPIVTQDGDGFSFPLKDSPGGYRIIFGDGYIGTYISKLFNYKQYLKNQDSGDYTANGGINRLYLPDPGEGNNGEK